MPPLPTLNKKLVALMLTPTSTISFDSPKVLIYGRIILNAPVLLIGHANLIPQPMVAVLSIV
jgi:hypothetical protein